MKPKLRFPGYEEEWEEKKLGKLANIKAGKDLDKNKLIDSGFPVFGNALTDKGLLGFYPDYEFEKDAVTVTGRGDIGKAFYRRGKFNTVGRLISVCSDHNPYFLAESINRIHIFNESTGVPQLTALQLKEYNIPIPSLPEQEKIGEFFSLLDQRIEKQEEKIELMKERKKGWMQKLFHQEIRFKDENGNDYPDWEEKKLGEISEKIKAGGTPKTTIKEFYNGDIPFLTISDMTDNGKYIEKVNKSITKQGLISSSAWELPEKNLLLSMYASIGKVAKNLTSLSFSQAIVGIILNEKENQEYIYQYLNYLSLIHYYDRYISEGTQKNLNIQKIKNIELYLPSLPEQEKIANFLSTQDELIEKEEEKLNLLKEQKKGLLQQMFV